MWCVQVLQQHAIKEAQANEGKQQEVVQGQQLQRLQVRILVQHCRLT